MLGIFPTTREPLRGFVDRMSALEGKAGILSVSLAHGFPWGDTPEVGMRVLVVADGDVERANVLARRLGDEIWTLREQITPPFMSIDEVATRVAGHNAAKPLVLADTADNPGIGASGDSTFLMRRFLERKITGVAVSPFWDPIATDLAFEAGLGATLDIRLGGKLGPASGAPLDLRVVVKGLVRDARERFGKASARLGNMAWLRAGLSDDDGALDIIVNDYRTQGFSPAVLYVGRTRSARRSAGSSSSRRSTSTPALRRSPRRSSTCRRPARGAMDMRALRYKNVSRPLWPRVADPHA